MRIAHLTALVVALAISAGAWVWYSHSDSRLEPQAAVQALTAQTGKAGRVAAMARAQAAASVMERFASSQGTYVGATAALLHELDPTLDASVAVVSATDVGYCVQAGLGDAVAHAAGPGGLAAQGPCPA